MGGFSLGVLIDTLRVPGESAKNEDLAVQPTKLPDKQVKVLPGQFPFWLCSYIRHQGRVTYLMKAG